MRLPRHISCLRVQLRPTHLTESLGATSGKVKSKRARCAGSRAGAETASPGCAGTVESGLCRHIPVCRHTARGPRERVYASLEL